MEQLRMYRGDARTLDIPITLGGVDWDVPLDATVRMTAKLSLRDPDSSAVFIKSTDSGITIVDNIVRVTIDPEDTANIQPPNSQDLQCDVQVTSPTVGPWTVARFVLVVDPDVSITQP